MPCRALGVFGLTCHCLPRFSGFSLNALSGIGGFRTKAEAEKKARAEQMGLNALSGIGGFRTILLRSHPGNITHAS